MMDEKKEQILNAAIECFTAFGYEKTSMSDIGKRVGLNKASIYYHYKDKLALFDAMVNSKRQIHRSYQREQLAGKEKGIASIVTFLCTEIDFVEELAVNFLAAPTHNRGGKDDTQSVFQEIIQEDITRLIAMIQEAWGSGGVLKLESKELARLILQTSRGLLTLDCPLDGPIAQRATGYQRVRQDIRDIIPLLLKGAGV
ncbi:MAG: TetR/AcrR family transcriptional regulator [Spirochaetaceae bacterium]|jgi:AcrR family transcriptional regulator|nr:TetR/AcrR family transcriptional regulator [Spirochaetaceae bacterium]